MNQSRTETVTEATRNARKGCVVVIEPGACWPASVIGPRVDAQGVVVVRAEPHETDRSLLARAMLSCAKEAAGGVSIQTAVLSCCGTDEDSRLPARARLACGLLSKVLSSGPGRLVLVTDNCRGPTANSLIGLAGTLLEFLVGTGTSVDVRAEPGRARARELLGTRAGPGLARCGPGTIRDSRRMVGSPRQPCTRGRHSDADRPAELVAHGRFPGAAQPALPAALSRTPAPSAPATNGGPSPGSPIAIKRAAREDWLGRAGAHT
jgi:hypothetical protein